MPLVLEAKKLTQIGKAVFIKDNCIVKTEKTACGACSEHCPTKACSMIPYEGILVIPEVIDDICIGCGACVAACKNSSAMLFVFAKVSHLALLPQGDPERKNRAMNMVAQMDKEGFGACTNTGACEAVCPKGISIENIARLNREYIMGAATAE